MPLYAMLACAVARGIIATLTMPKKGAKAGARFSTWDDMASIVEQDTCGGVEGSETAR